MTKNYICDICLKYVGEDIEPILLYEPTTYIFNHTRMSIVWLIKNIFTSKKPREFAEQKTYQHCCLSCYHKLSNAIFNEIDKIKKTGD